MSSPYSPGIFVRRFTRRRDLRFIYARREAAALLLQLPGNNNNNDDNAAASLTNKRHPARPFLRAGLKAHSLVLPANLHIKFDSRASFFTFFFFFFGFCFEARIGDFNAATTTVFLRPRRGLLCGALCELLGPLSLREILSPQR